MFGAFGGGDKKGGLKAAVRKAFILDKMMSAGNSNANNQNAAGECFFSNISKNTWLMNCVFVVCCFVWYCLLWAWSWLSLHEGWFLDPRDRLYDFWKAFSFQLWNVLASALASNVAKDRYSQALTLKTVVHAQIIAFLELGTHVSWSIQELKRQSTAFARLSAYAHWLQRHRQTT